MMTIAHPILMATLSPSECDRKAWAATCQWPAAAGMDPVREGIDVALLSRSFLWDKVGRAIRRELDPEGFALEAALLAVAPQPAPGKSPLRRGTGIQAARRALLRGKLRAERALGSKRMLYAPFPYARHARILEPLLTAGAPFEVVVPGDHADAWPGAIPWRHRAPPAERARKDAEATGEAIVRGLLAQGIDLLDADVQRLLVQLEEQRQTLIKAHSELDALRPDALLVPADNHPPFIEHVLAARQRGIPVIMLQHGLDCERFYLDDAYATHIAVWGLDRERRYRRDSCWQPTQIAVVGNPHYDHEPAITAPADLMQWLWVTRPHAPGKCYAPSRRPDEGLRILDALIESLQRVPAARLVIKPHPFDHTEGYRARIAAAGTNRVDVVIDDTVTNLLAKAGVVVTEDSTAGMDAMLLGRVVVHAHFSPAATVMPFVDYGAALPGFTPAELADSVHRATSLARGERDAMRTGQARFLDDFAGPRDRQAGSRFAAFVEEVVNRR